ncbi:hypothetical protein SEHO0A_02095 [Salmonella enterica subsp. houtenae str. ATCC BAA-1581]|nr:hypothetical protein SEHO0A_02095 [Salmonella enterica subsp. houtenae str. ATCC BAA-1581]
MFYFIDAACQNNPVISLLSFILLLLILPAITPVFYSFSE